MQESFPGMLNFLKKIFSKPPESEATPTFTPPATPATAVKSGVPVTATAPAVPPSDGIPITLKATLPMMPESIRKRMDKELTGVETFYVSRSEAMRQLPTGSVKIAFSEIHRMVPNTFLTPDQEMLSTQISLPLQEILPKIKTLPRRAEQKQIEVPEDMEGIFGAKGSAKVVVSAPTAPKTGSRPAPPAPEPDAKIPKPATPSLPKPPPPPTPPVPQPTIVPKPASSKPTEEYAPPAPKPLETQAPIAFKLDAPSKPATPLPVKPPTPTPPPVPTPAAPKPAFAPPTAPASAPAAAEGPTISFGEIFGQPDKKDWTPQEIVQKAAALRGVAGAIITTADGLPVAFQLPENLNGNVIGAFVPQMFTRIIQYTRDLKLGDAKHLTLLIENTPLQIFKSGSIYFTALGKPNETLPKPQLTAIAAALGRPVSS